MIESYEPYAVKDNKHNVSQKDMSDITGALFSVCEELTKGVLKNTTPEVASTILTTILNGLSANLIEMKDSTRQEFLRRFKEQLEGSSLSIAYHANSGLRLESGNNASPLVQQGLFSSKKENPALEEKEEKKPKL